MDSGKNGTSFGKIFTIISMSLFFTLVQVTTPVFTAEWDTSPKGRAGDVGNPDKTASAAGRAGEEAGKSVSRGVSVGTIAFSLAMVAGTIAIGLTTFGGGDTTTPAHH